MVQPACRSTAAKGVRKCVSEGVRERIRMGLHGGLRQGAHNIVCNRMSASVTLTKRGVTLNIVIKKEP